VEREAQQAPVAGAVKESNLLIKAEGQQEAAGISRNQREKSGLQPCVLVREKKKEKKKNAMLLDTRNTQLCSDNACYDM
jgi:hypothetical protein